MILYSTLAALNAAQMATYNIVSCCLGTGLLFLTDDRVKNGSPASTFVVIIVRNTRWSFNNVH